jgi:hypothetical protein
LLPGENGLSRILQSDHTLRTSGRRGTRCFASIAAIRKDRSYVTNISKLWEPGFDPTDFREEFIDHLSQIRELSKEDRRKIEKSLNKLRDLTGYSFTALTLNASVDEETIAEVFVRINGKGKPLNQADFIMTLMSVFWEEGRVDLEAFSHKAAMPSDGQSSPFNHFIKPSPDQMLRATVGLALKRARLENVYSALRGRDPATGLDNPEKREGQFALTPCRPSGGKCPMRISWSPGACAWLRLFGRRGRRWLGIRRRKPQLQPAFPN